MPVTIYPVSDKYGVQTRTIDETIVITLVIYDIQAKVITINRKLRTQTSKRCVSIAFIPLNREQTNETQKEKPSKLCSTRCRMFLRVYVYPLLSTEKGRCIPLPVFASLVIQRVC
jgi:hypothetical protein